jgi:hypothetical protein
MLQTLSRCTEGIRPFPCRNAETEQSFFVMSIMVVVFLFMHFYFETANFNFETDNAM